MAKDLTHGSITKNIAVFSAPVFLTLLFQTLFSTVDSMMTGNLLSAEALGSVASGSVICTTFVYIANGYAVGYKTVTGQLFGGKKYKEVREAVNTSLCSMLGISLLVTVLGTLFTVPMLKLLGTIETFMPDAITYLRWYFIGVSAIIIRSGVNNLYYALGETKLPMYFQAAQLVLHIGLDFVLLKYTPLGVMGLALAGIISRSVTLIPLLIILLRRIQAFPKPEKRFCPFIFKKITAQAIPACLANSINMFGALFVTRLVNSFGDYAITANNIVGNINNMVFIFTNSVASAAGSFAAQNFGAHSLHRVRRCAFICMAINGVYGVALIILFRFLGGQLATFFIGGDTDPILYKKIIDYSVQYLNIISCFYIVYGTGHVVNEMLRSVGKTKITVIAMILYMSSRLLISYGLAGWIGDAALPWGIVACWITTYGYTATYFFIGRWVPHNKVVRHRKECIQ
ncbi:MAG: hypothetical protein IJ333_04140 [Clostridia bacterium]|nr:hypothetical protein [Clostridia bacterium]